ncbi:MAG: hypothetical protein K8S55_04910 [Phycisphaerae bacterium]|nr:hypothetical protein [Phycisphaerae bacterium]
MADSYTSRTLREIVRIIASRFGGMVIIFAIVVGGVALASFFAPKWYRSEVQLMASPSGVTGPLEGKLTSTKDRISLFVMTQRQIIMSDYVLASALMKLDPKYASKYKNHSEWDQPGKEPWFDTADVENFITENSERLREFKKRVAVVTPGGVDATFTQTFKIRVDWPEIREGDKMGLTPTTQKEAAKGCYDLAKYLVKAYLTRHSLLQKERAERAEDLIKTTALKEAKDRRDKAEAKFTVYSNKLGDDLVMITSIVGERGIDAGPAKQATELERSIRKLDARMAEQNSLNVAIDTELAKKDPAKIAVPSELINANIAISTIQEKVARLKIRLNMLSNTYTDAFGEVIDCKAELAGAYKTLQGELIKQRQRTQATINMLTASKMDLGKKLKFYQQRQNRVGPKAIIYGRLQRESDVAQENYEAEEKKLLESIRAKNMAENPVLVSVLDDPTRPNPLDPRRPLIWMNILIACVGGLILSLAYAFMADHFDHTIKSVDEAERYLGTPVIASVPKLGRRIIRTR